MTLDRLKKGLNGDLRRELIIRGVTSVEQAYELAKNCELAAKTPFMRRSDIRGTTNNLHPSSNRPPRTDQLLHPYERMLKGKKSLVTLPNPTLVSNALNVKVLVMSLLNAQIAPFSLQWMNVRITWKKKFMNSKALRISMIIRVTQSA